MSDPHHDRGVALERARAQQDAGRAERAEALLENLAANLPEDGEVRFMLAQAAESAGRLQPADRHYRAAENLVRVALARPEPAPELWLVLGRILFRRNRPDEAAAALGRALRLRPASRPARELLDEILRRQREGGPSGPAPRPAASGTGSLRDALNQASARPATSIEERQSQLRRLRTALPPAGHACDMSERLARYQLEASLLDFGSAARLGESILDRTRDYEHLKMLLAPFVLGRLGPDQASAAFHRRSLAAADRFVSRSPRSPWPFLFRRFLNNSLQTGYAAMNEDVRTLSSFPVRRYGWLGSEIGKYRLTLGDFAGAIPALAAAADYARPVDWVSRCHQAEALLCLGRRKRALALMDSLSAAVGDKDLGAVLAWKAKLLLWIGRPAAALELLRLPAVRSSPEADLLGGAALCGLGRYAQALPVLARRSAAMPEELECRVWRMEALFRLGRPLEALDEARRAEPLNVFRQDLYFHVVRGLSRAAGDSLGLRLDYNAVRQRAYLLDYLVGRQRRKLERYDDAYIRGSLEAVLRLSRGVRRGNYEISIWLKP